MDDERNEPLVCPFCEFNDRDISFISQHVEVCHAEEDISPSNRQETSERSITARTDGDRRPYIDCPHGCGESVTATELQTHLDLHIAEMLALEDVGGFDMHTQETDRENIDSSGLFELGQTLSDPQQSTLSQNHDVFLEAKSIGTRHGSREAAIPTGGRARRLGHAELGPYAHEKKMPSWLLKLLQNGAKVTRLNKISPNGSIMKDEIVENETSQVIPVLMQLCQQDDSVQRAFFCSTKVRHIFKLPREGGFCGYRNIQMLISHIHDAQRPGHEYFHGRIPSILQLQDLIERAWNMGYNSTAKIETGGIKGTRKYIGTPEAQALFLSLGIRCEASAFTTTKTMHAHDALLQDVATYFRSGGSVDGEEKVLKTDLAPIYFQHQGHSMTIIGFEVNKNGNANLLVFDPMFKTSPAIRKLAGKFVKPSDPGRLMKAWRRGVPYLQKYRDFELLRLCI